MAQQADNMRQQLTAIEADKNRLYGSVAQAVNVIEEKYGAYKEVALNDQSYESYVENMRQLYENTSAEYRSLTGRIERLTKELYALEGIRHDVERLMKLCHVQENLTTETLDEQIGLKRRYEELLRRYEQMQSQYFAKRDAFEKDKAKAVSACCGSCCTSLGSGSRSTTPSTTAYGLSATYSIAAIGSVRTTEASAERRCRYISRMSSCLNRVYSTPG